MNIDFDYKINDPNKILFLVKNVFEGDPCPDQFLSCDCFDESECHHLSTHSNDSFDFNQNRMSIKCSFCQFYDYLNKNFTTLKTNMENTKSNSAKKHYINLRFKKRTYSPEILEWCNVFTWKSPFALTAFASCKTDDDIYRAIKNFQQEKEKFKKTLICSKLFIDVHKKHEMSEEFQKTIRKNGSKVEANVPSHPNIELDSISTIDSSLLAQTSFENIPSSLSDNVSIVHPNVSLGLISDNLLNQNQKSPEPKQVQVSEAELKKLVQSMEKDILKN
ncbi:hypothetical protein BpHYR1_031021 [Brachionus plicatilis]|uniref:Uncharacterized protein n=1 Tax=Brachionus plicatilis TaxID=10195 RepID=A0A3M7PIN4_BRAPC|nr:hypothetical protein BpHYR1_031021 [Brachionus plicatilis]